MLALIEKKCSKCQSIKPIEEFHKSAYTCKPCANQRSRDWHKVRANLDKRNARVNVKQRERKQWAVVYKGNQCLDCGNQFPLAVYDFHHRNEDDKSNNPSYFIKLSKERAISELDKCDLLCANCHRIRHFHVSTS